MGEAASLNKSAFVQPSISGADGGRCDAAALAFPAPSS
jgi:hypothetical protein